MNQKEIIKNAQTRLKDYDTDTKNICDALQKKERNEYAAAMREGIRMMGFTVKTDSFGNYIITSKATAEPQKGKQVKLHE